MGRRRRRRPPQSWARLESSLHPGQAVGLDVATLRAGLSALERRRSEAVAGYREALRGWRGLGLAFDEAMAALDMALLLAPTEREMAEAAARDRVGPRDPGPAQGDAAAGQAGCREGGRPLLSDASSASGSTAPGSTAPVGAPAEVVADR